MTFPPFLRLSNPSRPGFSVLFSKAGIPSRLREVIRSSLHLCLSSWPSILAHWFTHVFSWSIETKFENCPGLQTEQAPGGSEWNLRLRTRTAGLSLGEQHSFPEPVSLPSIRGKRLTSGPRGARWKSDRCPLNAVPPPPRGPTARAGWRKSRARAGPSPTPPPGSERRYHSGNA